MTNFTKIILSSGKDQSLLRFHPWVFSGAIKKIQGLVSEGDVVELYSNKDEYLATGHYQVGSIAIRVFSFEQVEPDFAYWKSKLEKAYNLRTILNLTKNAETTIYRLVNAEGDQMPGLIIDFYNGTAVLQTHSIGMHLIKEDLTKALQEIYGDELVAVYDKSADTMPHNAKIQAENGYLYKTDNVKNEGLENGVKFNIEWEEGQKTGFFIDQRNNRELLAKYSKGKSVLNTFCYTGGFSVYALKAGATLVHSVDSSKKAIDLTDKNVTLNGFEGERHESFAIDTFKFLEANAHQYDVIILDPPAFAKHHNVMHQAIQGYKRLNALAFQYIKPGGIIFTFSCSQVINKDTFRKTIYSAAIQSGRTIRVLDQLNQPEDHAISIYHAEGEYLKGLVLQVE